MDLKSTTSVKAERDYKLVCLAIQNNDRNAYNKLMELYESAVYYSMLKMVKNPDDAKDLTIEAFEKAFSKLSSFDPEFAFSTWLFKIATNNCIDFIRKKKSSQLADLYDQNDELIEPAHNLSSVELNPEEKMIREQYVNKMRQIVNKLKPHYKCLIELRYYNEMGYTEISETLKATIRECKSPAFQGKRDAK